MRALHFTALLVSGMVILLAVAGISMAWGINRALTRTLVDTFDGVAASAMAATGGLEKIEERVASLEQTTIEVQDAAAQLAAGTREEGVVRTLLPEEVEQNLASRAAAVKETFDTTRQTVTAAEKLGRAVNQLPLMDAPEAEGTDESLAGPISEVGSRVESLRTTVAEAREGTAQRIEEVSTSVGTLSELLQRIQVRLAEVQAQFTDMSDWATEMERTIRRAILLPTVAITFVLAWVVYSQVVLIRMHWARFRSPSTVRTPSERDP
jgi:hypothetical protein